MEIKSIKQKYKGFTLIELIIAIAIMGLLATITLAGFSQGNKRRAVVLATDSVLSAVRTAQNDSLNPQPIRGGTCTPDNIPTEYHLSFISGNQSYALNAKNKCGASITLQTFKLPQNTRIATGNNMDIDGTGVGSLGGSMDIRFVPPFAAVSGSVNGSAQAPYAKASVKVESLDGKISKQIIIDGISGRVDVQ